MRSVLETVVLHPLTVIYSFLFAVLPEGFGAGARIIAFSLALNLALIPIYNQMESRSRRTRRIRERVAREVARMKRHFLGRERYFYIRAVYRQHGYHPLSELLASAELFVQVLVFATVYRFLSGLDSIPGQSFGPIDDLGRPDGLLWGANLLPLLMTAVNGAAAFAYVDDRAKRFQALGLGGLFLILLYASASGLVLYWTMNNVFSVVRTIFGRRLREKPPVWLTQLRAQIQYQR